MVDLPAPDSPVNQTMHGPCALSDARTLLLTVSGCRWMLTPRRSAKSMVPAARIASAVALAQDEAARLGKIGEIVDGKRRRGGDRAGAELVLRASVRAASWCSVSISRRYFTAVTLAVTVRAPSFSV